MAISKLHETLASDGKLEILVKGCSIATRAAAEGMPAGAAAGGAERNNRRSELLAMLRRASIAHSPSTAAAKSRIWNTEYGIQNRPPRAGLDAVSVDRRNPEYGIRNTEYRTVPQGPVWMRFQFRPVCSHLAPSDRNPECRIQNLSMPWPWISGVRFQIYAANSHL